MIKIQAAARLKEILVGDQITAGYTGTKSNDLVAYIKTLAPELKLSRPGPPNRDPSIRVGTTTIARAYALGDALIKDGWTGARRKNVNKETKVVTEYIIYMMPEDASGNSVNAYVCLYKPDERGDVRIKAKHTTAQSSREFVYLNQLNRKLQRMFKREAPPKPRFRGRAGL